MNICFFGDSITYGALLTDQTQRFSTLVSQHFNATEINAGVSGNTSISGLLRIQTDVLDKNPDIVVIAFGMNDFICTSLNTPQVAESDYKNTLEKMITACLSQKIKVVLCNISPVILGDASTYFYSRHPQSYFGSPSGAQAWIDNYNTDVLTIKNYHNNVVLVDVSSPFKSGNISTDANSLIFNQNNGGGNDGVHPSPAGHQVWANVIIDAISKL